MMDKRKRVLLIERDNAVCHCIRNILKKDGYDVDFANNVKDALTTIQNNIVDLVLFDRDSLGINISEFISLIKDSTSSSPGIVAMVNSTDGSNGHDYAQLAVDDLIIKPLNSTELQYRIHRVLDQRNSVRVFNTEKADLESTRQQLIQSERLRALCELATGAVHNFNNLLSGILGHTQMLLSRDIDAAMCERLQIVEKLVLDGSEVVKRVREFTGICTLKDFTRININDIVNDVVRMTESKWSGGPNHPGIILRVDTDSAETPVVEGNASELREVFINILFNAVDAMPNGGKLTIQTRTNKKDVFVCFFDTGEGMSKETKKRVFDPFFTTKGSMGMGLGMSIAYGIINRHNGQIIIDSELGAGTAVTVQFPISKKFIEEMQNKSHHKQSGKTKTLLIEDSEVTTDVLAENLIN